MELNILIKTEKADSWISNFVYKMRLVNAAMREVTNWLIEFRKQVFTLTSIVILLAYSISIFDIQYFSL